MPRSIKLLVGAATAAPLVLIGYLFARCLAAILGIQDSGGAIRANAFADLFHELSNVFLLASALLVVLLAFYLWHVLVLRARRDAVEHVVPWVLALVLLPIVAMPIYWFVHVWPEVEVQQGAERRRGSGAMRQA